eukprot:TRINITY_DN3152_c0_g1_i3.p1 TRINITY_DN3152_c0_g1~~TRINITY_DN3152_c0_g1_i3.p1  ORF type:complete len:566 (+),score=72.24 TRINITY_DN3152_c0_g1_i3:701-2398(+)
MRHRLPAVWTSREMSLDAFEGDARPGENYTFQLGVYAHRSGLNVTGCATSSLQCGHVNIPMRCMNFNGSDYWGRPYTPEPTPVAQHTLLPVWVAVSFDTSTPLGACTGTVGVVTSHGLLPASVGIGLSGEPIANGGDGQEWRGTRLHWLDSKLGLAADDVPSPFVPLSVTNGSGPPAVTMLDKLFTVADDGMLATVTVGTAHDSKPTSNAIQAEALQRPVALSVWRAGKQLPLQVQQRTQILSSDAMSVSWEATQTAPGLELHTSAELDASGYADFTVKLSSSLPEGVQGLSVQLEMLVHAQMAMGLGVLGGYIEDFVNSTEMRDWKWDGQNGNNAVWLGSTAAGLRLFLKGADDEWQAAVPFDSHASPEPPASWDNGGMGGIAVATNGTVLAYTGEYPDPNRTVVLQFSIMATPVRPLDLPKHYSERYAQLEGAANYSFLAEQGASVVNIHQGNGINPWINYRKPLPSTLHPAPNPCLESASSGTTCVHVASMIVCRPPHRCAHSISHQLVDEASLRRLPRSRPQVQGLQHNARALQPMQRAVRNARLWRDVRDPRRIQHDRLA